ncbi:MAG: hypothetical protein KDK91_21755 [Gammaproteobacteria bacterium]|nr:hypothetical protein [Gammaproteobacteria bacterium]
MADGVGECRLGPTRTAPTPQAVAKTGEHAAGYRHKGPRPCIDPNVVCMDGHAIGYFGIKDVAMVRDTR